MLRAEEVKYNSSTIRKKDKCVERTIETFARLYP
jgi:hypothetical protein